MAIYAASPTVADRPVDLPAALDDELAPVPNDPLNLPSGTLRASRALVRWWLDRDRETIESPDGSLGELLRLVHSEAKRRDESAGRADRAIGYATIPNGRDRYEIVRVSAIGTGAPRLSPIGSLTIETDRR